jgi:2-oxo-3-hexenedioate decarboxylase
MRLETGAIAIELLDALDRGRTIRSVVERHPGFEWDDGYKVAADLLALRQRRGERPVGRKIGFTNRNIWPEYGATSPIWAHVYDRTLVFARDHRARVSLRGAARPRLEPEIAFKLKATLPAGVSDPAQVLQLIEWFAPSFEIVDCHFADWKFKPADAAADFSFHWRLIVGEPHVIGVSDIGPLVASLRNCTVTLRRDGATMDRGVGANALGHPATALAFLADILSRQPRFAPLSAGEVITTGTLTAALPIQAGETWSSEYRGLPVTGLQLTFTG